MSSLAAVFAWIARRAWSAKRAWVKWPGTVLAGLLALLFALSTGLGGIGQCKLYARHSTPLPAVTVPGTPEQIARGERLAEAVCADRHATNGELPLSGGENMSEDAGLPLGDLYAPNLTPASEIEEMSDTETFLVIRTGVEEDGRASMMGLLGMHFLSDEDVQAPIAYLRNSPTAVWPPRFATRSATSATAPPR